MKKTRKKTTYGRVTVTQSGKYFRIRWRENNKTKEKTSTSYEKACSIAQEIDARLEVGTPGTTFGPWSVTTSFQSSRTREQHR